MGGWPGMGEPVVDRPRGAIIVQIGNLDQQQIRVPQACSTRGVRHAAGRGSEWIVPISQPC
jgi:hypothetical protein